MAIWALLGGEMAWWAALLVFLAPDLAFAAYLAGPRAGAVGYNLAHLYGGGALMLAGGLALGMPWLAGAGAPWLAHVGFDRALGYGLKLPAGFGHTHLGRIGRAG